jgi:putative membrane protein
MRLLKALIALVFVSFGVLFGALNRETVRIELGFHTIEDATLGLSLLLALLAGALLAGLVLTVGVIWPMRHRLRRGAPASEAASAAPVAHE